MNLSAAQSHWHWELVLATFTHWQHLSICPVILYNSFALSLSGLALGYSLSLRSISDNSRNASSSTSSGLRRRFQCSKRHHARTNGPVTSYQRSIDRHEKSIQMDFRGNANFFNIFIGSTTLLYLIQYRISPRRHIVRSKHTVGHKPVAYHHGIVMADAKKVLNVLKMNRFHFPLRN